MANHARIFYYAQRVGVGIEFAKYKDWLARHPSHVPADVLPDEYRGRPSGGGGTPSSRDGPSSAGPDEGLDDVMRKMQSLATSSGQGGTEATAPLGWQKAAPRTELYVDKSKAPQQGVSPSSGTSNEPDYPIGFAQMLEMIQKGLPVPGIREIPATVVRDAVRSVPPALKPAFS